MKKTNKNKYPLRKVLGCISLPYNFEDLNPVPGKTELIKELLECGHAITPPQDIYGEYYANRRRCRRCFQNIPPLPYLKEKADNWGTTS